MLLNYRLQPRQWRRKKGETELQFPSSVRIEATLSPAAALGSAVPGRTGVCDDGASRLSWNACTDRHGVHPGVALPVPRAIVTGEHGTWALEGERVCISAHYVTWDEFIEDVSKIGLLLPALLNVELVDPTTVTRIEVHTGDSMYLFEYERTQGIVGPRVSSEIQSEHIAKALTRLDSDLSLESGRIQAALHYFHVASRLLTVAESPWEFMPEAILNLNKVLEVLFSTDRISQDSHQQARVEMDRLGLEEDMRESLISLMKLRNHMDVAHVDTWSHAPESLEAVYALLYRAESNMRDLLRLLLERLESGEYELKPEWDSSPHEDVASLLRYLDARYVGP